MRLALVVALLLVLSAVGCSSRPIDPPPSAPTSAEGARSAPVEVPLSTAGYAERPCDLLASRDSEELGLAIDGRQRQTLGAQVCQWRSPRGEDLSLTPDRDRNLFDEALGSPWRGTSVRGQERGYPSIARKSGSGDLNICTVIVGLGPRASLTADWVGVGSPGGARDACGMAKQAVALVIRKLPRAR